MKVKKVLISSYEELWIVLDNEYKPIKPIMETGRRISEVCSLNYDCLEQYGGK